MDKFCQPHTSYFLEKAVVLKSKLITPLLLVLQRSAIYQNDQPEE